MRAVLAILAITAAAALAQAPSRPHDLRYSYANYAQVGRGGGAPQRHARDVSVDPKTGTVSGDYPVGDGKVFGTVQGDEGRFGYKTNVFDDARGKLDASAYHSHSLGPGSTSDAGGRLDWHDDHAKASLDIARNLHGGPTNLNAAGGGTWPLGKNWDASAQGTYSQSLGHGRPDFGVLASINGRF